MVIITHKSLVVIFIHKLFQAIIDKLLVEVVIVNKLFKVVIILLQSFKVIEFQLFLESYVLMKP